jgi:hypothetical protein
MTTKWRQRDDFIVARNAERRRIRDRMAELEKKIEQARARHEYHTTLELQEQLKFELKELEMVDGKKRNEK